jgi:hypothetical protein
MGIWSPDVEIAKKLPPDITARQNSHHHETIPDNSTVWNPPSSISTLLITKIQYPKLTVLCFCYFYVFMIF